MATKLDISGDRGGKFRLHRTAANGEMVAARFAALLAIPAVVAGALTVLAPSAAASTVAYRVESDGSLSSVTYFDGMNDMKQLTDANAPWSTTVNNQATYAIYGVTAQTTGLHVSCTITVNGQVRDQQSAQGRYAVVNCSAA